MRIGTLEAVEPFLPALEHLANEVGGAITVDQKGVFYHPPTKLCSQSLNPKGIKQMILSGKVRETKGAWIAQYPDWSSSWLTHIPDAYTVE